MALRPDVDLRRSGPERIIFDIRNGVIPQLLHIDARTLGRFDNSLGERGSNQRSHGGVSLIPPAVGPKRHQTPCGVEACLREEGSYRHAYEPDWGSAAFADAEMDPSSDPEQSN